MTSYFPLEGWGIKEGKKLGKNWRKFEKKTPFSVCGEMDWHIDNGKWVSTFVLSFIKNVICPLKELLFDNVKKTSYSKACWKKETPDHYNLLSYFSQYILVWFSHFWFYIYAVVLYKYFGTKSKFSFWGYRAVLIPSKYIVTYV